MTRTEIGGRAGASSVPSDTRSWPRAPASRGGRLAPRERGKIVEHLGDERDLLLAEPAELAAPVEQRKHLLERARHRLEPQEPRARSERVQAPP